MSAPTNQSATEVPASWVLRWQDPGEHPVVVELRERREALEAGREAGTEWGVVQDHVQLHPVFGQPILNEATAACREHPRVELTCPYSTVHARWMTEAEYDQHLADELASSGKPAEEQASGSDTPQPDLG